MTNSWTAKLMIAAGSLCLIAALAILLFAMAYLTGGAGLQFFGFLGMTSVVLGWFHLMGLLLAAGICFCVGVALLAHGTVRF